MVRTDVLLDDNLDLIDTGEEWAEGESDEQHVELLVLLPKGAIKQYIYAGFGIKSWLKKRFEVQRFLRQLEVELANDGYENAEVQLGNNLQNFKIIL
jgi:hypothetical protein